MGSAEGVIVVSLILMALCGRSAGDCHFAEEGTGYYGGDLKDSLGRDFVYEDVESAAECCRLCQETFGCAVFVYGWHKGAYTCWLKGGLALLTSSTIDFVAGYAVGNGSRCLFEEGLALVGGDMRKLTGKILSFDDVESAEECCKICQDTSECATFTYGFDDGGYKCTLKETSGWEKQDNSNFTSGYFARNTAGSPPLA